MNKRAFIVCLLFALLAPALLVILRLSNNARVEAAQVSSAPARVSTSYSPSGYAKANPSASPAETVATFLDTVRAWQKASGPEGDRLEEQLRSLITDENAEALLRAAPPDFRGTYVANLLLSRWASHNRDAAILWLAAQRNPTLFEVNAAAKNWVVQDPQSLSRYLDSLPASTWKSLLLESTGRDALTNRSPELAFSLLQGMNDGVTKTALLANAVQLWAQWDPASAVESINQLSGPAVRERLVLAVASGYAMANPSAAAEWLRKSFPEGPVLDRGLSGVVQASISSGVAAAAAQWLTKLPPGSTRDHAFRELIAGWSREDAETFENWLSALPEGPVRIQAESTLHALAAAP